MTEHVALLQERVLAMRQLVETAFARMHVPFATGYAGFFSWLNLREYLKADSYEGEQELYKFIYEHGNIIIAPVGEKEDSDAGNQVLQQPVRLVPLDLHLRGRGGHEARTGGTGEGAARQKAEEGPCQLSDCLFVVASIESLFVLY